MNNNRMKNKNTIIFSASSSFEEIYFSDSSSFEEIHELIVIHDTDSESDSFQSENGKRVGFIKKAAKTMARNSLHIPAWFVNTVLEHDQDKVTLFDSQGGHAVCKLQWHPERTSRSCLIKGSQWYQYCKSLEMKPGDRVCFGCLGNPYELEVTVTRK